MFISTIRGKVSTAGLVFGAALALSAGYGLMVVNAVQPDIFRLNGAVVSTFPTTRALQIGGAFTQGGGVRATSTSGTVVPLLATDFDTENLIDVTLNVQSGTLSFPATTSLASTFLPATGMVRELFVRNATTTAATALTISGGTGILVKFASSTPATTGLMSGDTDGANMAKVVLIRKANTDIEALVTFFKD